MSTRVQTNFMVRHTKIPFHVLPSDEEFPSHEKHRDGPKFRNMVDRLVGNLRKQRRYMPHEYKHERLTASASVEGEENFLGRTRKASSSLEKLNGLVLRNESLDFEAPLPDAASFRGRRRSRSESDLAACEIFARRRAAICEEMERTILMENGVTLRKCRKNLVLNQILENLSLL